MVEQKFQKLKSILNKLLEDGLAIAYSGGVDSAFLLWTAVECLKEKKAHSFITDDSLVAVLAVSASLAHDEKVWAIELAKKMGAPLKLLESNEVEKEAYALNDKTRCYHCKSELFEISQKWIANQKAHIAYGYNFSDSGDYRPGHQAAKEYKIHAPLYDAELTKSEIRSLIQDKMGDLGLGLKDKPATPCLSSRLMTGVRVTPQKLKDIDEMESVLRKNGLKIFRLRLHEEKEKRFLRLEVDPTEMHKVMMVRGELLELAQQKGYAWVTLDLAGYKTGGGNVF